MCRFIQIFHVYSCSFSYFFKIPCGPDKDVRAHSLPSLRKKWVSRVTDASGGWNEDSCGKGGPLPLSLLSLWVVPGECSSPGTNQNGGSQAMVRGLCWEWWMAVLRGNWTSISYSSSGYWEVCSVPSLVSGKWCCWRMSGWNWFKAWMSGGGDAVTPPLWPHSPVWGASLVAQLLKNPPAMRETWVPSLGLEGPLEKGTATHSSILAMEKSTGSESQTRLNDFHFFPTFVGGFLRRLGRAGREPRVSKRWQKCKWVRRVQRGCTGKLRTLEEKKEHGF